MVKRTKKIILLTLGGIFMSSVLIACFAPKESRNEQPVETSANKSVELKIEYGFDGNEFVIHNIMDFPLTRVYVSLDIREGMSAHSILTGNTDILEPGEYFYPEFVEMNNGKRTTGVTFPLQDGLKIKTFSLSCEEGDISEESKVQYGE